MRVSENILLTLLVVLDLRFIRKAWWKCSEERTSHKERTCVLILLLRMREQQLKQSITTLNHTTQ